MAAHAGIQRHNCPLKRMLGRPGGGRRQLTRCIPRASCTAADKAFLKEPPRSVANLSTSPSKKLSSSPAKRPHDHPDTQPLNCPVSPHSIRSDHNPFVCVGGIS